jgi:hypothetical protein
MATKTRHDWTTLDPLIDNLKAKGRNDTQIAKELGIGRQTLVDHLRSRELVHLSTPGSTHSTVVHQGIAEHQGTLEGYQEVIEDVQQSIPEPPHISTPEHQGVPQQPDSPEVVHPSTPEDTDVSEAHPSTPEGHQELSPHDSTMAHSGVPARQAYGISTPMVHPGTPTREDWDLWMTIKARWLEVEKMLADRQVMLSTPRGTPGHTQKKTHVVDVRHVDLIDRYAQDHRLELKDVMFQALEEFFQRRGYAEERS